MTSVKEERQNRRREARLEQHRQRSSKDRTLIEFQPDAVEIEQRSVPGGARWTLYTVMALICAVVAWSYFARVDKIVTATGKLVTVEQPVVIQTNLTAPIKQTFAQFGDRVKAGDLLVTLDPTLPEADLNSMQALVNSLDAATTRLTAESDGEEFIIDGHESEIVWVKEFEVFHQRRYEFDAKVDEFKAENEKLKVQAENTKLEIAVHTANTEEYKEVEEKYERLQSVRSASDIKLLSSRIARREAETKILTSQNRGREIEKEMTALQKRAAAYVASWRSKTSSDLVETLRQKETAEQDLAKASNKNDQVEIRVPVDMEYDEFVVFEVADRGPGSVVQPGEPIYKLIPLNVPYEAEIEVRGKDIALIGEGDTVRIKIASFPYQKHGTLNGEIRFISEGVFEKENQGQTQAMFRARVRLLDSVKLDNVPEDFRLMPGMTTIAEVKVGRRRVIQYFLYPLIRYWDESIREP